MSDTVVGSNDIVNSIGQIGSSKVLNQIASGEGGREPRLRPAREDGVIISECAGRAGKDKFVLEPMPPAKVKNREQPVEIYRVWKRSSSKPLSGP